MAIAFFPCASTHPECFSGAFLVSTHRGQQKEKRGNERGLGMVQGNSTGRAYSVISLGFHCFDSSVSMVLLRGSVVRLIGNSRRGQLPVTESVVSPYHHIG